MNLSDELLQLEKDGWRAVITGDAPGYADRMLASDMKLVLPGMVLDRADAVDLWLNVVPWDSFEIENASVIPLAAGAAVVTYQVSLSRRGDVTAYRAQCTTVYRRSSGRWRVAFQQQTPFGAPLVGVTPDLPFDHGE